jgi:hypothetical protein
MAADSLQPTTYFILFRLAAKARQACRWRRLIACADPLKAVRSRAFHADIRASARFRRTCKRAFRFSVASSLLSNGLSITRATAGTQSEVVMEFDKKASLLICRVAILCTIILAPEDYTTTKSEEISTR